jgi:hypothetical protein
MVLLPVLSSMFDHLGRNGYGVDLLCKYNTCVPKMTFN